MTNIYLPNRTMSRSETRVHGLRRKNIQKMSPSRSKTFGLSIARVVRVDPVTHELTLRVITGEDDEFQHTSVVNNYPAAGARHFMGALPEPDDVCVVAWLATEPRIPVVVAWVPISLTAGLEWLPVQDFLPSEVDLNPKIQSQFEGIYSRRRHKMRAMATGDVLLSSSKGSDILLDEGVLITNRRANEIRLRDQDQAIVFRSLQQFHAMAGARTYSGMVQRDARFLPARMFSNGVDWAAPLQQSGGSPIPSSLLGDSAIREGGLTPHPVFARADPGFPFPDSGQFFPDSVDPYNFLQKGLFIGSDGFALDSAVSDVEYGGKPIFRVSFDPNPENTSQPANSAGSQNSSEANTLTEYRIEIDHSSDGRLPVTEQTDGFDADRLPSMANPQTLLQTNLPFVEWVLGSVVGNDAFSAQGKALYGFPLAPRVFDGEPRFESGLGVGLGEHAATLLRVTDPLDTNASGPSFVSLTKDGRAKISLAGPPSSDSLEMALKGGLRVEAGGPVTLKGSALNLNFAQGASDDNLGFSVRTQTGAIKLSAGGATTQGVAVAKSNPNALRGNSLPSLILEAPNGNAHLTSGQDTKISGAATVQLVDTNEVSIVPKRIVRVFSDKILSTCNTLDRTVLGKETTLYSGPKNSLPSNGPLREVKFTATPATGHVGGTTDEYTMQFGDRVETIRVGNHTTEVQIGDMSYTVGVGTYQAKAGLNRLRIDSSDGAQLSTLSGTVSVSSTQTVTVTGTSGVTVKSSAVTRVSGTTTILGGSGNSGLILSSVDKDPLTNLPFSFFGLGSSGHLLGPAL